MGTAQDSYEAMGENYNLLESKLISSLGFTSALDSTGQIYPRSLDYLTITTLVGLSAAPSNLATAIRLMAGHNLVSEGFKEGQVGSSAMPHKMNTRSCERVNGFAAILKGYATMIGEISGAFYAIDGLIETTLTILKEFGVFPAMIEQEIKTHLPFLASSKILLAAVKNGMGREDAHQVIKEISLKAASDIHNGIKPDLLEVIAQDSRIPLNLSELKDLIASPLDFTGLARQQCETLVAKISNLTNNHPKAVLYIETSIR
jgi:adenylosuccinate lyase